MGKKTKVSKTQKHANCSYTILCDVCEQCNQYADELFSFNGEIKRCSYCMKVEGLCQTCGDYIPFPDPNNDNDSLWQLDDSSDYAPTQCLECFFKKPHN
ncbi:MAG: hypothetical protein OEV44_00100 [Spirochaetota bacterium]|nr:hypothetical protein [Spirochaetota bacterium]